MNRGLPHDASITDEIEWLVSLGPGAQGVVDESLLRDNLRLSPLERLEAAGRAADAVDALQAGLQRARHRA